MMYGSWDMEGDGQRFWSFWTVFCPFTLLTTQKSKFWKNEKNTWRHYRFTEVYHKWQSYDVWFPRYEAWQTEFFVILDCFLPFYPTNNPKNQNFEKLKQVFKDIIILHKCTKNNDCMLYCSWNMVHNGCNCYFLFWSIFCPFTSLTTRKSKI